MNEIDLQIFCAKAVGTHDGTKPFVADGWRYAGNLTLFVRIQSPNEPNSIPISKPFLPAPSVFSFLEGDWLPWPDQRYCPECFDDGEIRCSGCRGCDGCGIRKCLLCISKPPSGQALKAPGVPSGKAIAVGPQQINLNNDQLIRTLPKVEYFVGRLKNPLMLAFRFDGGEGRVMGISPGAIRA